MATVFCRGFYREIENLRLQCAWSGEVTGKNSKGFFSAYFDQRQVKFTKISIDEQGNISRLQKFVVLK